MPRPGYNEDGTPIFTWTDEEYRKIYGKSQPPLNEPTDKVWHGTSVTNTELQRGKRIDLWVGALTILFLALVLHNYL
jgi:hypothetical protein